MVQTEPTYMRTYLGIIWLFVMIITSMLKKVIVAPPLAVSNHDQQFNHSLSITNRRCPLISHQQTPSTNHQQILTNYVRQLSSSIIDHPSAIVTTNNCQPIINNKVVNQIIYLTTVVTTNNFSDG